MKAAGAEVPYPCEPWPLELEDKEASLHPRQPTLALEVPEVIEASKDPSRPQAETSPDGAARVRRTVRQPVSCRVDQAATGGSHRGVKVGYRIAVSRPFLYSVFWFYILYIYITQVCLEFTSLIMH